MVSKLHIKLENQIQNITLLFHWEMSLTWWEVFSIHSTVCSVTWAVSRWRNKEEIINWIFSTSPSDMHSLQLIHKSGIDESAAWVLKESSLLNLIASRCSSISLSLANAELHFSISLSKKLKHVSRPVNLKFELEVSNYILYNNAVLPVLPGVAEIFWSVIFPKAGWFRGPPFST